MQCTVTYSVQCTLAFQVLFTGGKKGGPGVPQYLNQLSQLQYSTVQCTVQCTEQCTVHCTGYCSGQCRYVGCLDTCGVVTSKSVETKCPVVFPKCVYKNQPIFSNSTVIPGLVFCLGLGVIFKLER